MCWCCSIATSLLLVPLVRLIKNCFVYPIFFFIHIFRCQLLRLFFFLLSFLNPKVWSCVIRDNNLFDFGFFPSCSSFSEYFRIKFPIKWYDHAKEFHYFRNEIIFVLRISDTKFSLLLKPFRSFDVCFFLWNSRCEIYAIQIACVSLTLCSSSFSMCFFFAFVELMK